MHSKHNRSIPEFVFSSGLRSDSFSLVSSSIAADSVDSSRLIQSKLAEPPEFVHYFLKNPI